MKACLLLTLLAAAIDAGAAETPNDFAYAVPIEAQAESSFYRIELPRAVYEGVTRGDLGDLRVFNAAGEVVPHGFLPRDLNQKAPALKPPLFPLLGTADGEFDRFKLRVETSADGAVVSVWPKQAAAALKLRGYLVDVSATKENLQAIELEFAANQQDFFGKLTVEASDDLAHWRVLSRAAPVVQLRQGNEALDHKRIEFPPQRAKYLRLSWAETERALEIESVRVEPATRAREIQREWKTVVATADKGRPNEYLFDSGGRFPADRLRVQLPQTNTVAQAQFLTRAKPSDEWRPLTRAALYRLRQGDVEIRNPDLRLAPERYLLMRIDANGGGLGQGVPTLELGWLPHQLVFAARGEGPFQLAYGNQKATPAAYPIASLVPG